MIISFAYTTDALLAGQKTVTRRDWAPSHAAKFYPGLVVDAWSRNPRVPGARKVAEIQIVSVRLEPVQLLLDNPDYAASEVRAEGDLWDSPEDFIGVFGSGFDPSKELYRIEFELIGRVS